MKHPSYQIRHADMAIYCYWDTDNKPRVRVHTISSDYTVMDYGAKTMAGAEHMAALLAEAIRSGVIPHPDEAD